jgi:dipeptidyl aminopeptidase/acylaminoacyl peptidase
MIRKLVISIFTLFFTISASASQNQYDLAKLPGISEMQVSPNGKGIAYLQTIDDEFFIVTTQIDAKKNNKPKVFGIGNALIRDFEWVNNERIIFSATFTKYSRGDQETFTFMRSGILNVEKNEAIWPFNGHKFLYNIGGPRLISKLAKEPNYIIMANYYNSAGSGNINKLFKINIENGDKENYFYSNNNNDWLLDDNGIVLFVKKYDNRTKKSLWHYRENSEQDFTFLKILTEDKRINFQSNNIVHFDADNNELYYFEENQNGRMALVKSKMNNNILEPSNIVAEDPKYDITNSVRDYNTTAFLGIHYTKNIKSTRYIFDKKLYQVQLDLEATFPSHSITITSYSTNKNRYLVKVSGPQTPNDYFFYDRKHGRLEKIISGYSVDSKALGNTELFSYLTEDKLEIDGYFTLPSKLKGELPPLIVLPHGGPESRDSLNFDWLRSSFSLNGYAVYQPNFRGSSGYGTPFAEAGYGEWGEKMQLDIDNGVKKLIKQKKVDANRICIVGGSYGGYAAMIGATKSPNIYKCAISFGGISNLDGMFYHTIEQLGNNRYWEKSIGKRRNNNNLYNNSPKNLVTLETSPILLMHGDKDTVVPTFQSENMYKSLKELKIKGSNYIELENADHWFSTSKSRNLFISESLAFLEEFL